jgi:hypothetical protein
MKTISTKQIITIDAPVHEVFPLVCPVREYEWIREWKCKLIHCPNGKNEKDVVFKEKMSSPFLMGSIGGKTTWTTLLHDTINHRLHFNWDNKISNSLYKVEMVPIGKNSTKCVLDLTFNIVNEKGMKTINDNTKYKIDFLIAGLGSMLKYYCESGNMLYSKGSDRLKEFANNLSLSEKITFALNKINLILTFDHNRKKYFSGKPISVEGNYV